MAVLFTDNCPYTRGTIRKPYRGFWLAVSRPKSLELCVCCCVHKGPWDLFEQGWKLLSALLQGFTRSFQLTSTYRIQERPIKAKNHTFDYMCRCDGADNVCWLVVNEVWWCLYVKMTAVEGFVLCWCYSLFKLIEWWVLWDPWNVRKARSSYTLWLTSNVTNGCLFSA